MLSPHQQESVDRWQIHYDKSYLVAAPEFRATEFPEWISTYDDRPVATEHMVEWRDLFAARATAGNPSTVLDIGCGTGMLTELLALRSLEYWGTDISEPAIEALKCCLEDNPALAKRIILASQPAHDVSGLPTGHFDLVVLNSVVQYFPDLDYLTSVLRGVGTLLAPGGRVVIGDVRDSRTALAWAAVAWHRRRGGTIAAGELLGMADRSIAASRELFVHPDFFLHLNEVLPAFRSAEVLVKRGHAANEITRNRYDVILYSSPHNAAAEGPETLTWGRDIADFTHLAQTLSTSPAGRLRVRSMPDSRSGNEYHAYRLLQNGCTIDEYARRLSAAVGGACPECLLESGALVDSLGGYVSSNEPGHFDAVFGVGPASSTGSAYANRCSTPHPGIDSDPV